MPTLLRTRVTRRPRHRLVFSKTAVGPISGTIAANLTPLTITAAGWAQVTGTAAITLPALTISATGTGGNLPNNQYHTAFPNTESPVVEGGVWTEGLADGLDWSDFHSTTNKAFGTQSGDGVNHSGSAPYIYNDSIAVLKGTWTNDQYARGVVVNGITGGSYETEVELLLRFTITAHSAQGYEVEYSVNPSNRYFDIVRWNGALGDFTPLTHINDIGVTIATGDVVEARIVGTTISAYLNGSLITSVTDATYSSGDPGMGAFRHINPGNPDPTLYGYSDYTAVSLNVSGTASPTLQGPTIAGSGTVVSETGTAVLTLGALTVTATGWTTVTGTAPIILPALRIVSVGGMPAQLLAGTTIFVFGPPVGFARTDAPVAGVASQS